MFLQDGLVTKWNPIQEMAKAASLKKTEIDYLFFLDVWKYYDQVRMLVAISYYLHEIGSRNSIANSMNAVISECELFQIVHLTAQDLGTLLLFSKLR